MYEAYLNYVLVHPHHDGTPFINNVIDKLINGTFLKCRSSIYPDDFDTVCFRFSHISFKILAINFKRFALKHHLCNDVFAYMAQ